MPNSIFKSRRFLTLLLDVVVSFVLYFVAKYAAPGAVADVQFVVAALQPVFVACISAYAIEDYALAKK